MILGKYGQAKTVTFDLVAPDGVDLIANATFAAGDVVIMKDEGLEANTTNLPTAEGTGYSLILTAAEFTAARIRVYIIDQTATKVWLDISLGIETYGNASAEHAFDLDTASTAQTADHTASLTNISNYSIDNGYLGQFGFGVHVDSTAVNTNTVRGVDGIHGNPVSTLAAARTIADAIGSKVYYLDGNSSFTLAAAHADWVFCGSGEKTANTINLGSQDVSRSMFHNVTIEGLHIGARFQAYDCALQDVTGAGITTLNIFGIGCGIVDDITLDTSNDNVLIDSYSLVAGSGAPIVRASGAAGTLVMNGHKGGVDLRGLSASHNLTVNLAGGQVIFDASNNINASVSLRGVGTKTDNTAGMANLSERAFINLDAINTEADQAIADAGLTVSLDAAGIRSAVGLATANMDTQFAASVTATGFNTIAPDNTSIAAILADTNELHLNQGNWLTATGFATEAKQDNMQLDVDAILVDTATTLPGTLANLATTANLEARTPTAAQLAYITANASTGVPVTFTSGTTTTGVLALVDSATPSTTNDQYNGRLLVFNNGTLKDVVTDITDYDGATTTVTITSVPVAVGATHTARLI